ncbi:MAG: hypothetical protein AAGE43_03965 [Pseudomonadota bacterium]
MTTKHAQPFATCPTHEVVAQPCAWPLSGQYAAGNVNTSDFVDLRSMLVTIHDPGSGG